MSEAENFDKVGDRIKYELHSIQSSRHFRTTQPDKAVYVLSIWSGLKSATRSCVSLESYSWIFAGCAPEASQDLEENAGPCISRIGK